MIDHFKAWSSTIVHVNVGSTFRLFRVPEERRICPSSRIHVTIFRNTLELNSRYAISGGKFMALAIVRR